MSASPAENPGSDGAATPSQLYVINLCASTTPMALSQPSTPELKRYTFFVSRQREDGRERFRMHMGYFATQQDAERLLQAVRDVYPAAWAGPAPTSGVPRRNRIVVAPAATPVPVPVPAPAPKTAVPPDALELMSNVRDVIAQLSEPPPRLEVAADAQQPGSLSENEVLHVLEAPAAAMPPAEAAAPVPMVAPRHPPAAADAPGDADGSEAPCFAVQLVWSVSPIDAARLPHLAIFDAYTLYNVEGSRDGRKWYGVRLGFFSDPSAAAQVANYVRSDYRAVAVVPVAGRERDGAGGGTAAKKTTRQPGSVKPEGGVTGEPEHLAGFELLADDRPAPIKHDIDDKPAPKASAEVAVPVAQPVAAMPRTPGKAAGKPVGKRAVARKRPPPARPTAPPRPGAPNPLESTLEILGASNLVLDNSREILNDSAVRKPIDRKGAGNRFAKLLSRLAGQ